MDLFHGNYLIGLLNGKYYPPEKDDISHYDAYSSLLKTFNFLHTSGISEKCINYFALGCASLDKVNSQEQFFPIWLENKADERPINIIAIDHFYQYKDYHFVIEGWKKEDGYYSHPEYPQVRAFLIDTLVPTLIPSTYKDKVIPELVDRNSIATQEFYKLWESIIHQTNAKQGCNLICNYCVFVHPPKILDSSRLTFDRYFPLFPQVLQMVKKQDPYHCLLMTGTKFTLGKSITLQLVPYWDTKCINHHIYITDFLSFNIFDLKDEKNTNFVSKIVKSSNYYFQLAITKDGKFQLDWNTDILLEVYSQSIDIKKQFFQSRLIKKTTLIEEQESYTIKESLSQVLNNWLTAIASPSAEVDPLESVPCAGAGCASRPEM